MKIKSQTSVSENMRISIANQISFHNTPTIISKVAKMEDCSENLQQVPDFCLGEHENLHCRPDIL